MLRLGSKSLRFYYIVRLFSAYAKLNMFNHKNDRNIDNFASAILSIVNEYSTEPMRVVDNLFLLRALKRIINE